MMLSEQGQAIVMAIREMVGENMLGVDLEDLISHDFTRHLSPEEFLDGIEDAELYGFVRVSRMIGTTRPNIPNVPIGLRAIAGVSILEAGHVLCDSLLSNEF